MASKITDFGLSAPSGSQTDGLSSYMPPEALEAYQPWFDYIEIFADQFNESVEIQLCYTPDFTLKPSFDTWIAGHIFSAFIFDQALFWQDEMTSVISQLNPYTSPEFTFRVGKFKKLSNDVHSLIATLTIDYDENMYWESFYPDQISHPMMPLLQRMCHPDPFKRPSMSEVVRELHKI